MATQGRKARAVHEALAYRKRLAEGTAEPSEEFLAKHEDLRDLLEPLLEEVLVTESVQPAPEEATVTPLPDSLQQEVMGIHSRQEEDRAGKIEELCRRHPQRAEEIRGFIEDLDGTEKLI